MAENFNHLSTVHERYRRHTDRQTDDRRQTDGRTMTYTANVKKCNLVGYNLLCSGIFAVVGTHENIISCLHASEKFLKKRLVVNLVVALMDVLEKLLVCHRFLLTSRYNN